MSSHRAVHVQSTGGPLQLVDADTPSRGRDQVRIAVSACGPCGTYRAFVNGGLPAMSWPLTPGHEIAGAIAEIGDGVEVFTVGDRVAVGWSGGHCTKCIPCRKGLFIHCENGQVRSWHYPGGYAESVTVPRLC